MNKKELITGLKITTAIAVMVSITFILAVSITFILALSYYQHQDLVYYQHQDLVNRVTIHDLKDVTYVATINIQNCKLYSDETYIFYVEHKINKLFEIKIFNPKTNTYVCVGKS